MLNGPSRFTVIVPLSIPVKDKVPSVVIHAAKTRLGWNETNKVDLTSGDEKIKINIDLRD